MYDEIARAHALELLASGASLNAVSKRLQISRSALAGWADDPRGAAGGSRPCPAPLDPSPEYSALFGFYLGDGHVAKARRYSALRITCDAKYPDIVEDVELLMREVQPARPTFRVPAPGCVVVQSNWKHWPCLFPQHGPGRKHERRLGMAEWQKAIIEEHPGPFLRGLFHSDGCLVKNWATRPVAGKIKRYEYPRWQFVNESAEIMQWCGDALDLARVAYRRTNRRTISVSRRADVARLTEMIGTKS